MKAQRTISEISRFVSCIFMMLALAWLTISLPIVYSAQQSIEKKVADPGTTQSPEEESENPFANTTEEKTPRGSNTLSEEYIHDTHAAEDPIAVLSTEYHIEHHPIYIAFYGDQDSPPPDLA